MVKQSKMEWTDKIHNTEQKLTKILFYAARQIKKKSVCNNYFDLWRQEIVWKPHKCSTDFIAFFLNLICHNWWIYQFSQIGNKPSVGSETDLKKNETRLYLYYIYKNLLW